MSDDLSFLNQNIVDVYCGDVEGIEVVYQQNDIVNTCPFKSYTYFVVEYKGNFYKGEVLRSAEEVYERSDFVEVKPIEKTIIEYVPV